MIAWRLIITAGLLTGVAVAISGVAVHWIPWHWAPAAIRSFAFIVGWRAIANGLHLNDDFLQLTSVGDCGCLLAGALTPAAVGLTESGSITRRVLPAIVGGVAGFAINVVIL